MGRAFEYRKEKKFKRWDAMAKNFTRVGREIAIAVKAGGPDPSINAKLRLALNNAKGVQMPKDRVEAAIKRAVSKDEGDFEEIVYEGYGPFGIAMMIECATDNPTRTVANIRMYFNRGDGALGTQGSVAFSFDRKGVFKLEKEKVQLDDIELDLIDAGAEDIREEEDLYLVTTSFADFGTMQNKLEELNAEVKAAELVRIPLNLVELPDEQMEKIYALIDKFEEDDDVVSVFHNMKEE
jgi:YebC/PmpR family DNA-binding regulatory protein